MAVENELERGAFTVLGKKATKPEYYVCTALTMLDIPFLFQVAYLGGRNIPGGQVLDILAFTPLPTPIQVFGRYWHEGQLGSKDRYNLSLIEAVIRRPVIVIWSDEAETLDDAMSAVKRHVLV